MGNHALIAVGIENGVRSPSGGPGKGMGVPRAGGVLRAFLILSRNSPSLLSIDILIFERVLVLKET